MERPDPSVTRIAGPWRHHEVHANGIRFQCVEALSDADDDTPPTARPLVILLHGFASFWWSWRHQLRGLSGARVVAVDLRGYGGSDKPPRGYDGWTLAGDTAGLIRALGHTSATLVGHADGGLVCWATAVLHSRMVQAIALVSSPHPAALKRSALACPEQRRALLPSLMRYQLPRWPENLLTRHDAAQGRADRPVKAISIVDGHMAEAEGGAKGFEARTGRRAGEVDRVDDRRAAVLRSRLGWVAEKNDQRHERRRRLVASSVVVYVAEVRPVEVNVTV
jgi:pimeloyl-ACP methyl ester carboxylesterase